MQLRTAHKNFRGSNTWHCHIRTSISISLCNFSPPPITKNWNFPQFLAHNPISKKPCMRHGQSTLRPMPHTAQTPTCSGMQAKSYYEAGLLPSPLNTSERSSQVFGKPVAAYDMPRLNYPLTIPPWTVTLAHGQNKRRTMGGSAKKHT